MASGKTTRAAKHPDQVRDSYAKAADHGPNDEGSRFHPASVERSGQAYRHAKACPPPGKGTPFRIGIEDGVSEACDGAAVEKRIQVRAPVVAFPAVSVQASDDRGIGRRRLPVVHMLADVHLLPQVRHRQGRHEQQFPVKVVQVVRRQLGRCWNWAGASAPVVSLFG